MKNNKTDKLEQFVLDNRQDFDLFDPPAGMFLKITAELEKKQKRKIQALFYLRRIAAVMIILLAIYAVADIAGGIMNTTNHLAQKPESARSELNEALYYYTAKIDDKRVELEAQAAEYPEILQEIKREFTQLDEEYRSLENDLKEDVSNEMVIEAMIKTAKIKLDILEKMHKQMQRIDDKNIKQHEEIQL